MKQNTQQQQFATELVGTGFALWMRCNCFSGSHRNCKLNERFMAHYSIKSVRREKHNKWRPTFLNDCHLPNSS